MSTCTRCGQPARWRSDDELLCAAHGVEAGLRGRRLTLEPAEEPIHAEVIRHDASGIDLDDHDEAFSELERERPEMDDDGRQWANAAIEAGRFAADEIRRLRARVAELEAGAGRGGCEHK